MPLSEDFWTRLSAGVALVAVAPAGISDSNLHRQRMDLLNAIKTRRTARSYGEVPVPLEVVERLVSVSTLAPSACNRRGWRFILVEERADLDWLYMQGAAAFLRDTGQALLVCYPSRSDNSAWHDTVQSAAAAIAYFQLLAHAEGIGSCWICHLPPKHEVQQRFAIPRGYEPVALISFGYYRQGITSRRREPADSKLLVRSRWGFDLPVETPADQLAYALRRFARWIYYLLPGRKHLRKHALAFEKKFPDDCNN